MGSFEWMELQTLNGEITNARTRLATARSQHDVQLVRILEEEITASEGRRTRLLAHISNQLATTGQAPEHPELLEGARADQEAAAAEENAAADAPAAAAPEPPATAGAAFEAPAVAPRATELAAPVGAHDTVSIAPVREAVSSAGGDIVWDQLTPADLERAKTELGMRRAEILARHAEELKGLDIDQAQLEALDQAIEAFTRKFTAAKASVVHLDEQRETRLQSHG